MPDRAEFGEGDAAYTSVNMSTDYSVLGTDVPSYCIVLDLMMCDHSTASNLINMSYTASDYSSEDSASAWFTRLRNC